MILLFVCMGLMSSCSVEDHKEIREHTDQMLEALIRGSEEEAYAAGRILARTEGILCGITSGAALHAATLLAQREENREKTIVCLLPDTGDRYLSTPYFDVE